MNALDELRRAVDEALEGAPQMRRALADALLRYAAEVSIELTRAEAKDLPHMQGRAAALWLVAEVFLTAPADLRSAVVAAAERRVRRFKEVV